MNRINRAGWSESEILMGEVYDILYSPEQHAAESRRVRENIKQHLWERLVTIEASEQTKMLLKNTLAGYDLQIQGLIAEVTELKARLAEKTDTAAQNFIETVREALKRYDDRPWETSEGAPE